MTAKTQATKPYHLLFIAPSAPPKNSPEAMQVGRFLSVLDSAVRVTLVTTPIVRGWEWEDVTLAIRRPNIQVIVPELPLHKLSQRLLSNHRLATLHMPDSDFWLPWFANQVVEQLDGVPDVIYSRSVPFSSALLARRFKAILGRPWMMHLSDPWANSPYRPMSARRAAKDSALENSCFADADLVALTTEGQADFYRSRYPECAQNIVVTPNMTNLGGLAREEALHLSQRKTVKDELMLVYTGALYGNRNPAGFLQALNLLITRAPELAQRIHVYFIGNMPPEIAKLIDSTPLCTRLPPVSFFEASKIQLEADIVLSIEPEAEDPMYKHFLLSKVVDYLASGRPMLALTPSDSITSGYCKKGYGWAFSPTDVESIANFLEMLLKDEGYLRNWLPPHPPKELLPITVTQEVELHLRRLISKNA